MKMYRNKAVAERVQRVMPKKASRKNPAIEAFDRTGEVSTGGPRQTAYTKAVPKKKKRKGPQLTGTAYAPRKRKYQVDKATK